MILFSPEYLQYTLMGIILLPGILFAAYTSYKVNSTFKKYQKVLSSKGITGADACKKILDAQGVYGVTIKLSNKDDLNDNFNPTTNTITLSKSVYNGTDIAALGIAAHETGHAIQYAKKYAPIKVRTILAQTSNIVSTFVWPLVIIGIILNFAYAGGIAGNIFLWAGVGVFGLSLLFSLITLPVEFNASKRAINLLVQSGCVDAVEVKGAKQVLSAAALTYVAAVVVAALELARFLLYFILRSRDE